ncbi:hypothetical protein SAMN05421858_3297 [Haladaptatus litoreus]|uniref:Uncharacterized protein n=1 Tax=Haladaptatus litoreus TaxID=553468 RepID=A0A1N7CW84_9EURY|nr:hypothetical protein [Haladaptatus litoreus]SIR67831.1 hypothetical protein SAMN05421858_3297 [Haladaptatus litoreus]
MARSPELWAFIVSNGLLFISGAILLVLTSLAYYQNPRYTSYRDAMIGFGFIVLGGTLSPVYRLLIRSEYHLNSSQRLLLQSGANILVAIGLGLIFYAIIHHDIKSPSSDGSEPLETHLYEFDEQQYDD